MVAALVYGAMLAAACAWAGWEARSIMHHDAWLECTRPVAVATSIALGLVVAAVVILLTRKLVRRTRWARHLHVSFRGLLGPMSGTEIAFFAVASGIAEEAFFRGAMQPALGLLPTALLFGLAHVPPSRTLISWTLFAVIMGLVLGGLYALTGELAGLVLAHILINYENLHFIEAYDPEVTDPRAQRAVAPPSLVGGRIRPGSARR